MRTQISSSQASIWIGRLLLVLLAAAALAYAVVIVSRAPAPASVVAARYVCPMHPQVISSEPGDCPICRMALEPVRPATTIAEVDEVRLPDRAALHRFDAVARVKRYQTALEMRAPAWAESRDAGLALLYRDEAELIVPGERGRFVPSSRPADGSSPGIEVVMTAGPAAPWDGATSQLGFRPADVSVRLVPGQTGSVKLASRIRDGLVVRASAILDSPDGPYVLVVGADRRTFSKRPIQIGRIIYGYAGLVAGLEENEIVAADRTFFVDAERRFGGGAP